MLDLQKPEVFWAVLESLQTGVCIVDRDRKISFWNDGAEKITGYLRQEVVGRFCGEILLVKFHENKGARCERSCPLVAAMRDGKPLESRVYLHHKSGYAVPVSLRAIPIRDVHGHVVGAAETFVERPSVSTRRGLEYGYVEGYQLDAVTQLPDGPHTEAYLAGRLKFASEHFMPFGVLCVRVDHFATLTATHGLEASETILHVIAQPLRNGLDTQDFLGRWSDDQFLAIVMNSSDSDLLTMSERLKRLAQSSEIAWWGDPLSVTVSVSGTVVVPGEPAESILQQLAADPSGP
jgi:diguanylate cyclase (GGDEF)-like protein/PAS domain S-box-containing protein